MTWSLLALFALLERGPPGIDLLGVAAVLCLEAVGPAAALVILVELFRWSRVEGPEGAGPSVARTVRAHDARTCPLCKAARGSRSRGRRLTPLMDPRA